MPDKPNKVKKIRRKVLELRDDIPNRDKMFKIGHSKTQSQTFLPKFVTDSVDPNLVWADIAGLHDTRGQLVDFINSFIGKKLFNIVSNVKFIIPFTE